MSSFLTKSRQLPQFSKQFLLKRSYASAPTPSAVEQATKVMESGLAAAKKVAGPVGDRVGSMLGGYRQPLVYNFQVFTSLLKQVYIAESLAFPTSLSTWTSAYSKIYSRAVSPDWWVGLAKSGQWATVGIVGLEAYGIFKIGEIIGRRNLVGYNLKE